MPIVDGNYSFNKIDSESKESYFRTNHKSKFDSNNDNNPVF